MSNPWDEFTEKTLLLAMLECADESYKAKFEAAAARLGDGFNANQVRQKFYKLKKESENLLSGDGAVAPPKTPTATPRGKAAKAKATGTDATPTKTPNKTPASGKRKQKATATGDGTAASKKIKQEVEADAEVEAGAGVGGTEDSATTEVKDEAIDARAIF